MTDTRPESDIELHFCQACGVSIPQSAIDTGLARPQPDQCAFLAAPERCPIKFNQPPAPAAPPPAKETGTRILTTFALLYVVGVTTFLLVREMRREQPKIDLRSVAKIEHVEEVDRKIGSLNHDFRVALGDLETNDGEQSRNIAALDGRVVELVKADKNLAHRVDSRADELGKVILDLAERTVGLKGGMESVLSELRELGGRIDNVARKGGGAQSPNPKKGGAGAPPTPKKSKQDLDNERLLTEYIAKLTDKRATDQTRYNAAVQLGDLRYPEAVEALADALENDKNDLVRRACSWSLGNLGKLSVRAIPRIIAQIGGKQEYVGYMCERALGDITKAVLGQAVTFNFDPTLSARARKKVQGQWEAWWEKNQKKLLPN